MGGVRSRSLSSHEQLGTILKSLNFVPASKRNDPIMGKRLNLIRKFDEKLLAADAGYVRRTNRLNGKDDARRRVEVVTPQSARASSIPGRHRGEDRQEGPEAGGREVLGAAEGEVERVDLRVSSATPGDTKGLGEAGPFFILGSTSSSFPIPHRRTGPRAP